MASILNEDVKKKIEEKRQEALAKLSRKRRTVEQVSKEYVTAKRPNSLHNIGETSAQYRKPISAILIIISSSRFTVESPYDKDLITLFKEIPSKEYDSEKRSWTFGLEHYSLLVKQIQMKATHVKLNEVPRCVLNLFLQKTKPLSCPSDIQLRIPEDLYSSLMQFQKEGIEYCITRNGRSLIADDMGLGKTIQAISIACYYRKEWPLLVICPASVKMYWAESFSRWVTSLSTNDITVVMTTGVTLQRSAVNIVSYDILVKQAKTSKELKFDFLIVDESHFLKNYKTARAKAIIPLIKQAKRALLLSGTPALSRPIELYTQITAVDLSFRMKLTDFGLRYCNGVKNKFGWDLSGASNMQELQLYMEQKLMIRRMKIDVLDQLPSKRRQMVVLDPSMIHSRDRDFVDQMTKASNIKEPEKERNLLLPLFSKTALLKLKAVCQYIVDMLEGGRKLVVFAHHRVLIDGICESLDIKKYEYIRIDGSTLAHIRSSLCDSFQHNRNCLVAVLSITAANTGITLTSSSTVVFAELFWNPGVLVQAEDRVYRIGQQDSVNIHYLVAKETIDDYLWPLVNRKLDVLHKVGLSSVNFSSSDTASSSSLTKDPCDEFVDEVLGDKWFSTLTDEELTFLDN